MPLELVTAVCLWVAPLGTFQVMATVAPGIASPFASCTATFPVAFTAVPDVLAVTVILVLRKTGAEVVALMSRAWTKDSLVSLLPAAVKVIK